MKKFRLYSCMFINDERQGLSVAKTVEAKGYAEVIQEIESNAGWYTDDLIMWLDDGNNPLMFAYLSGKTLGVDLVKVVEGE